MKPTFSDWKDRVTFAFSESPVLVAFLALVVLGGFIAFLVWGPSVSIPPWVWSLVTGYAVLAPFLLPAGVVVGRWLRQRDRVTVYLVNAENHATQDGKTVEKYSVPDEIWAGKKVGQNPPVPINGGSGWLVREYDWSPEIQTLYVDGAEIPAANDTYMLTWRDYVEDLFDSLIEYKLRYNRARDRMSRMAADVQEATVNASAEARERGTMLTKTAAKDAWEDATGDMEDLDAELDDLPNPEDYADPEDAPNAEPDQGGEL